MSESDRLVYRIRDAHFSYKMGALRVPALDGIVLVIKRGNFFQFSLFCDFRLGREHVSV